VTVVLALGLAVTAFGSGLLLALGATVVLPRTINIRESRHSLSLILAAIFCGLLLGAQVRDPEIWAVTVLILGGFFSYLEQYARH